MKKVLILAYDFPPYNSVGAQRPYSWYKFMPDFGVYPIVVTRNWDGIVYGNDESYTVKTGTIVEKYEDSKGEIYSVPYKPNLRDLLLKKKSSNYAIPRKFLTVFYRLAKFMFHRFDNRSGIYFQARKIIKNNPDIDFIIATGEPFILFKYAHLLSKEFSIPWHADYRDDWINNHTESTKKGIQAYILKIEKLFEKKYLSNVSSISSVSQYIVNDIKNRTKVKNGFVLENGVDLSILNTISIKEKDDFIITYTGIMYDFDYMIPFSDGFTKFLEKVEFSRSIRLKFVGIESQMNKAVLKAYELKEKFPLHVTIEGRVPIEKAIEYQLESTVLLNLIAGDPSKGLVGAKCYSYAATKNPILSVSLFDTKETFFFPGRNIHTIATNADEVFQFLLDIYQKFELNNSTKTDISDHEIFSLSRESNTKKLLDRLSSN